MGPFAWDGLLSHFYLVSLVWGPSCRPFLGNCRRGTFVSIAWELSLGILAWKLSFGNFRAGSVVWPLSLANFPCDLSLGIFAWNLARNNRLATVAWEPSLGNLLVDILALELSFGNFRLEPVAWDLKLGSSFTGRGIGRSVLGESNWLGWFH